MNELSEQSGPSAQPPPDPTGPPSESPTAKAPDNKQLRAALPAALERHGRKCQICRHPDREDIENDYRDWHKVAQIARHYNLDDSALHRHLRAVGLIGKRSENLRSILDRILERGAERPISGSTVLRAVKAYTCLTNDNKWVEPKRTVVYIHQNAAQTQSNISNRDDSIRNPSISLKIKENPEL